jgi:citrate lyase beta subunit
VDQKPRARIMLRTGLSADWAGDTRCAVRLNRLESDAGRVDRMALAGLFLPAVFLTNVTSAEDVEAARSALHDEDLGPPAFHALIETEAALTNLEAIAAAGVSSLSAAGADGFADVSDARRRVAVAAEGAGIGSFDLPWTVLEDDAGFVTHLTQSLELGFTGCCALNEDQALQINAAFSGRS